MKFRLTALIVTAFVAYCAAYAQKIGNLVELKEKSQNELFHHLGKAPLAPAFECEGYWSWGSSVIKGEDGKYHMYVSRFPKSLPFHPGWMVASEIVHAVSDTPEGPYTFSDVALPARGAQYWDGRSTHNPRILKYKGKYCLIYMGSTHPFPDPTYDELTLDSKWCIVGRASKRTGLAVSDSPYGPWERLDKPILGPEPDTFYSYFASNPTPVILEDGSVMMIFKGRAHTEDGKYSGMALGVATAPSIEGPYTVQNDKQPILQICGEKEAEEDPFLWKDTEGFHLIFKDHKGLYTGEKGGGVMAHSKDGIKWEVDKDPKAYSRTVEWEDGTVGMQGQLERPFILFDESGRMTHIFFATMDGPGGFENSTRSWNMVIPIKQDSYSQTYDPVADPSAIVTCGNARFTVLTPQLVRMEWAADGQFEDKATLAVVNRRLDVPEFRTQKKKDGVTISTSSLTLTYKGNGNFTPENLKVEFTMADIKAPKGERKVVWTPGADDSGNLLGTTRTLDGFDGEKTREPYDKGILSRDGWAILDESNRQVLRKDDSDWGTWVEERDSTQRKDLYIFAYGHDYKQALTDFTKVAGKIPLPPKYAFGYWWSRYWQYSDYEFIDLARMIRSMGIPMDVMVVDMDWHETWGLNRKNMQFDEFGQRIGWTGYTWQKELFPSPENFLKELHNLGLKTSLNLHPASGIQPYEECYDRFVKDYTARTNEYDGPEGFRNEDGSKVPVPFRISDREWTDAYFNSVIHPIEQQGVDFWWLDWQQWKYCKYMPNLNNTFWLNRTFFDDKIRRSESKGKMAERPMIYHRWGGLGSHRYQIGFSGDTYDTWAVLGYLPYFTSTASNVGYGYWGHDIGGHMQKTGTPTDPELFTRWLQYGVFTPIFKTHCTKSAFLERRIWMYPDHFDILRDAIRLRYMLSPYIYNAARQTYDTGISICRPMYYDYPEEDLAYKMNQEFMFGDDILATVVDTPADPATGLSSREMWFPEGDDWYDMATGRIIKGGSRNTLFYTIRENPYYVKAGSVLPLSFKNIMNLQTLEDELCLLVVPGEGTTELSVYSDDGMTQAYPTDFSITKVVKQSRKNEIRLEVSPAEGSYAGMPTERSIRIAFEGVLPPESLKVNGEEIQYSRFPSEGKWSYDGKNLRATLNLSPLPVNRKVIVECTLPEENNRTLLDGKKGLMNRAAYFTSEVKYMYNTCVDNLAMLPDEYLRVAQCGSHLTEYPDRAAEYLKDIDLGSMVSVFEAKGTVPKDFMMKLRTLGKFDKD